MNVKIKRQIQHLWFIEELLQKILTIAERSFLRKHHNLELANFELRNFIGAILDHPTVIEFFREIVVKCEVKPDEDIYKGIHIKSSCQDMFIFQSQGYCSEVLSVWNYSEEVITKTSEEWNLLKTGLWKGNAYYPAFSCFTGEIVQVFFLFKHIHWLLSCRFSSSWTPLQCLFIPHKF